MPSNILKAGEIYCTEEQFKLWKKDGKLQPGVVYNTDGFPIEVYVEETSTYEVKTINNLQRVYPTITIDQFNNMYEALNLGKAVILKWKVVSIVGPEVSGTSTVLHHLGFTEEGTTDRRLVLIANGISIEYDYLEKPDGEISIETHVGVGASDEIYPVGSVYITVDTTFSPAKRFGGVWERVESGKMLATSEQVNCTDAPDNPWAANARGGSSTYTLSMNANDLPRHQHLIAVRSEEGIYTALEGEFLGGSQDIVTGGSAYNGVTTCFTGTNDIATFNIDTVSPYIALNVWWRVE